MATIELTIVYSCSDDCVPSGCPEHFGKLVFQSTSDAYEFHNGKGETKYFERNELEAFILLIKKLNRTRADSVTI